VPGQNPIDALAEYVEPIRKSLECVTSDKLAYLKPKEGITQVFAFQEIGGARVRSVAGAAYRVTVRHNFVIDQKGVRSFKVRTLEYRYALDLESAGRGVDEVFAYHWHPSGPHKFPHVHVTGKDPSFHKVHLPTSRISLEDFVRCLIEDFGIPARKRAYKSLLDQNRRRFFKHSKWCWDWEEGCK
jgi:hypothetical protein